MTFHTSLTPPRIIAPGGPVSRALAVMAAADPDLARILALRRQIADRIEADIALLDALSGDPDIEQDAGKEAEGCFSPEMNPGAAFHFQGPLDRVTWSMDARKRAPVIQAAAGCPLTLAEAEEQWATVFRPSLRLESERAR